MMIKCVFRGISIHIALYLMTFKCIFDKKHLTDSRHLIYLSNKINELCTEVTCLSIHMSVCLSPSIYYLYVYDYVYVSIHLYQSSYFLLSFLPNTDLI